MRKSSSSTRLILPPIVPICQPAGLQYSWRSPGRICPGTRPILARLWKLYNTVCVRSVRCGGDAMAGRSEVAEALERFLSGPVGQRAKPAKAPGAGGEQKKGATNQGCVNSAVTNPLPGMLQSR